eukprot:773221-Rhodomonas_salina.3
MGACVRAREPLGPAPLPFESLARALGLSYQAPKATSVSSIQIPMWSDTASSYRPGRLPYRPRISYAARQYPKKGKKPVTKTKTETVKKRNIRFGSLIPGSHPIRFTHPLQCIGCRVIRWYHSGPAVHTPQGTLPQPILAYAHTA